MEGGEDGREKERNRTCASSRYNRKPRQQAVKGGREESYPNIPGSEIVL